MSKFVTSDQHYGAKNIIEHCWRPFKSVDEMDAEMIARHNKVVKPGDTVYFLGDFAFAKGERIIEILKSLNGQKFMVMGNHDHEFKKGKWKEKIAEQFVKIENYMEVDTGYKSERGDAIKAVLCHYPLMSWRNQHHEWWHIHGHCHGNMHYPFHGRIQDAGVDCHDYYPISFEQMKESFDVLEYSHMRVGLDFPGYLDHHK